MNSSKIGHLLRPYYVPAINLINILYYIDLFKSICWYLFTKYYSLCMLICSHELDGQCFYFEDAYNNPIKNMFTILLQMMIKDYNS